MSVVRAAHCGRAVQWRRTGESRRPRTCFEFRRCARFTHALLAQNLQLPCSSLWGLFFSDGETTARLGACAGVVGCGARPRHAHDRGASMPRACNGSIRTQPRLRSPRLYI
eukprot:scaffold10984_cov128-Isochrysis_galbana.AAC.2